MNFRRGKGRNSWTADLSESLGVGAHVGEDYKDVLLALVGQVLGRRQRQPWGDDALDAAVKEEVSHVLKSYSSPKLFNVHRQKVYLSALPFKSDSFKLTWGRWPG